MSPQVLLADLQGAFSGVSLARGANGDTVAAWRYLDAAGTSYSVQARRRVSGGDWGAVVAQGPVPSVPDAPSVAVDGAGNATLAWVSGATPVTSTPFFSSWPRGGALAATSRSVPHRADRSRPPPTPPARRPPPGCPVRA